MNFNSLQQLVHDGYNHLDKYQMNNASACFHKALEIDAKQQDALYGLGRVSYKLKKWNESVNYFSELLTDSMDYPLVKLWRGLAYQNLNNNFQASIDFSDISYQEFDIHISYILQNGHLKEAIESIRAIMQIKPEFPNLWYLLGTVLHQQGFLQQAITSLTYELEINSDFAAAWLVKGLVLRELGCIQQDQKKLKEATSCISKAIELKGEKVGDLRQLALNFKLLKRNEKALNIYSQILNLVPNSKTDISVEDIYEQALLLISLNKNIEAVDRLNRVIWLDPFNFKARYNRVNILLKQGKYEYVIRDCNKILYEQKINSSLVWFNQGNALYELESIDLTSKVWALDSIQRAWELNPNSIQILEKRNAIIERLTAKNIESINVLIGFLTDIESPQRLIEYLKMEAKKETRLQDARNMLCNILEESYLGDMAEWLKTGIASPAWKIKMERIDGINLQQKRFIASLLSKLSSCDNKTTFASMLKPHKGFVIEVEKSVHFFQEITKSLFCLEEQRKNKDFHVYLQSIFKLATFLCHYRNTGNADIIKNCHQIYYSSLTILGNRQKIWPRYNQDEIPEGRTFWAKIYIFFYRLLVRLRLATVWYTPYFTLPDEISITLRIIKSFISKSKFDSSTSFEILLIGESLVGLGNTFIQDFTYVFQVEENLESAIQIFDTAIFLWEKYHLLNKVAETEIGLGRAYTLRLKGNKSENLEKAITYYENANSFFNSHNILNQNEVTKHKLMQSWGETMRMRIRGDKKRNLEKSIEILTLGLNILDPDKYTCEYADSQIHIADSYLEYVKYLAKFELNEAVIGKIDQAILLYLSAINKYSQADLTVDEAEAQYKIGGVYFLYSELLTDLKYENKIIVSNLKKSIAYFVSSKDNFGHNLQALKAEIDYNLGNSHAKLAFFEKKYLNLDTAIDCYTESLHTFTPEVFQLKYGQTKIQLGKAYYESGRYEEAYYSFLESVNTFEKLRIDIINLFGTEEDKQKFSEQWIDSYFGLVDSCLKLAQNNIDFSDPVNDFNELDRYFRSNNIYYALALEYIERSKAKNLVELISSKYLYPKQEAFCDKDFQEICSELDRFRREIPALQRKLEIIASDFSQEETQSNPDYINLAHNLANLRQLQNSLLQQISSVDSTFGYTQAVTPITFSEIQDLIDINTVAVEWFITHKSFCAIIVLRRLQFPLIWNYSSEEIVNLNVFLDSYLSSYREDNTELWVQNLPLRLQQLSNILHLEEILEKLIPNTVNEIVLIPHQKLHLVPLHALPLMDGSCLLDRFSGGIRYAPSCQILQQIQQKQTYTFEQLFAIKNPKNNLPSLKFADIELTSILNINIFETVEVVTNEEASRATVITKNVQRIECLHFACHGSFNPNSPLESALKLSGTSSEDINLTFIDIFGLSLKSCRLVTLSACETGIVDTKSISDEYIAILNQMLGHDTIIFNNQYRGLR